MKNVRIVENTLLSWIINRREQFSLAHATDAIHALQLLKPLGELVLACDVLIRGISKQRDAYVLMEWAWLQLDRGQLIHNLLLSRPDLIILTSIYSSFYRHGFQHRETLKLLKYLARTDFSEAVQFPNWRRLDFEHALGTLGIGKIRSQSIAGMWCAKRPEPWLIEHDSAYALTHEIFYVSDFGRTVERLPQTVVQYVALWLPSWINIFSRQDNWDLTAELLMVSSCIPDYPQARDTFDRLSTIVGERGFLPGPDEGGKNLIAPGDSDERIDFLSHYHTVLVGLMAANLSRWRHTSSSSNLTRHTSGRAKSGAPLS
ncbi:MAG: hypothetical protein JSS31_01755 [Proteobacteria bacterium]|nr:hypothetical protein [Pseudomonadota bacterium]MBS0492676.1 hypothetical protein [Pseudomonadota bacterium]